MIKSRTFFGATDIFLGSTEPLEKQGLTATLCLVPTNRAQQLLAECVRELMEEKEKNQAEVARAVHLKAGTVSGFLKGEHGTSLRRLEDLANLFEVDIADLFMPKSARLKLREGEVLSDIDLRFLALPEQIKIALLAGLDAGGKSPPGHRSAKEAASQEKKTKIG